MISFRMCSKNKISLFVLIVMIFELCLSGFNVMNAEAAQSDNGMAVATLGLDYKISGFEKVEVGEVSGAVNTVKADRQAWLMDKNQGNQKSKIGFSLSPNFKHTQKDGSVYELEIDYFDSGNGYFQVYYDAYTEARKSADIIYTNDEARWKTASITLDDASFTNRVDNKYDFTLTITARSVQTPISPESIAIGEVRVKRYAAEKPIYVTSNIDETGNAFKWFSDSKIIHNKIENLTDSEKTVTVTYKAESTRKVKVFEKTETMTLDAGETKSVEIDIGEVKRCDIYKYYVEVYSNDGQIKSVFHPFEFSIIKTDPNGIKNDAVYINAQLQKYSAEQREMGVEMLYNSNAAGGRGLWGWQYYFEKEPGVFSTNFSGGYVAEAYKKHNLKYMAILTGGNPLYGMTGDNDYPDTEEELEAFRRYVSETAKALNGVADCIEVLNEPNLESFNIHMKKGAEYGAKIYVDCLKVAYEEIKKVNPDIKVSGPVLCYIQDERGRDFFNAAMKLEMWKYIDALDLHPYGSDYIERCNLESSIEWFKEEFAKVGKPDIEIWNSEVGFSTADSRIDNNYRQGYLNAASIIFYKANEDLGVKNALYVLEQMGTIDTDREDRFGLTSPGYADSSKYGKWFVPTESYLEVTALNYYMAQSEVLDSYYTDDDISVNYFRSNKFDNNLIAIYSMDGAKKLSLDLGATQITLADGYGNETELNSENGVYTITVGNAPVYILGNISSPVVLRNYQQPDVINMFETFHGYSQNGYSQNGGAWFSGASLPNGWTPISVDDPNVAWRVSGYNDKTTGTNIIDICGGSPVYNFDETIYSGMLHLSFDLKVAEGASCNVVMVNAQANDNPADHWNADGSYLAESRLIGFANNKYSVRNVVSQESTGYSKKDVEWDGSWHKYDILVDFTKKVDNYTGVCSVYADGELLGEAKLSPENSSLGNGLKAFSIRSLSNNPVYVDNVYMHHYQNTKEFEAPVIALDYANAGVAAEGGTVDVVFSENINKDFLKSDFTVRNKMTQETVELKRVGSVPQMGGARLFLPKLEQGTYEVIVNSTVKGSISNKTVSNTVAFEVEGGTPIGEGARYYINENFDGYKGGMPADFDAAQYAEYTGEYASALTQTEHENNGKAIKLGSENDARSLEYKFGNKIYGGKVTVEFDVKHSNGGWAVGLMSAGDFETDTDYVEVNRYNQMEQDQAYAYWKQQHDSGAITEEWSAWQSSDARKSVFTTWQTENPDAWLNQKKTEITTRKNKNFLIGNTDAENAAKVYSAKSKSVVGTDMLSGAEIPANEWKHVKAVVDIDAGTGSFYLGENAVPYTITFTQPSSEYNTYKDARFARDEFINISNPAKASNKIIEGLMGIRLQKTAGTEVEFDNVKVYTDKSYNDFQDFNGKADGTAVPGWYFAGTKQTCNYTADAHRPESRISAVAGKSGETGDKALKLNNDTEMRYYIHPFEIPVKAATPFTVEFDVKNDTTSEMNARWMFALMEEAYMHQTGANTKTDAGIAENGETGTASDGDAFLRRNILSNHVYDSTAKTYTYGKIGYTDSANAMYSTNMIKDTKLALENGKWNHVKVLIEPVSSSYGADMTVTVTDESGVNKTSDKLRLHTKGSRFFVSDTYGCGFYTTGCTIDNLKVSQVAEEYKTTVTSINSIDVSGNKRELDEKIKTNELQLEVNLSSAIKSTEDVVVYYPELAEGQKPTCTVETQDYGKKVLLTLTDFKVGENITIYVSNKADIGTTYISKPSTTAATFKVEQSEGELKVTDFRLYEYVAGREYASGNKKFSCEGAWVPLMNETLGTQHTNFNNLKLVAKGYNTGSETETAMIAGFYENGEEVKLDTCDMSKRTISWGTFSEEYLIKDQETTGDKLKIFMWQAENLKPLAESLEYYLQQAE